MMTFWHSKPLAKLFSLSAACAVLAVSVIHPAVAQDTTVPAPPVSDQAYVPSLPQDVPESSGLQPGAGNATSNAGFDHSTLIPKTALNQTPDAPGSASQEVFDLLRSVIPNQMHDQSYALQGATDASAKLLLDGGPSIWAIAFLSIVTVALIFWKIWRLALIGAWSKGKTRTALTKWESGNQAAAVSGIAKRRGLRSKVVAAAMSGCLEKPESTAREETTRVARHELAEAGVGLRALELIATIAPLLGLLGTVLGMIAAFQALQESGNRADPSLLAGGIWEALLTTAAGMAVAIPASAALSWFESVIDRMRRDVEDATTRVFVAFDSYEQDVLKLAAE